MIKKNKFAFWHKKRKEMWSVESINWQTKEVSNGGDVASLDDGDLLQFTGLLDKNGKEIFENDIVCWTFDEKTKKEIVFHEGCFGHFNFMGINNEYPEFIPIHKKRAEYMIVCGNIYQNPELVGRENE
jgi:uncharacterized phage protein (TIGR01671 family)